MKRTVAVAAASLCLIAGGLIASQPEGMPDMSQMMDMIKQASAPGENHKVLETMAGEWTMTAKFLMDPSAPPEVSIGKSKNRMVLGGRHLMSEVSLDMEMFGEKMAFQGIGIMSYDKVNGKFQSVWLDTMGTAQMIQTGEIADGVITVEGTAKSIMGENTMKNVIKFVEGGYNMEFWEKGEAYGPEFIYTGVIEYRKN